MSIPRQLVKSFDIINNSKLVVTKDPSDDNLKEFGKAINNAIPDDSNQISYMIYKFMRGMYLKDKSKFIQFIAGMQYYEAMILWTDYDDILKYFELTGVIFLGWNKSSNKYQAARVDPTKKKSFDKQTNHIENKSTHIENQQEMQVQQFEQNDDYDVLFNRIAKIQSDILNQQ